jgi:hypothetical protein
MMDKKYNSRIVKSQLVVFFLEIDSLASMIKVTNPHNDRFCIW